MTLVRRNHFVPAFENAFDIFFGDLGKARGAENVKTTPLVNILENEKGFSLELAAPGLGKEDFNLAIDGNKLTISASQKEEKETAEKSYKRREFYYTNFSRSFELPEDIDVENIEAKYENGILNVQLPKSEEAPQKVRTIAIS